MGGQTEAMASLCFAQAVPGPISPANTGSSTHERANPGNICRMSGKRPAGRRSDTVGSDHYNPRMPAPPIPDRDITGLILAGGLGRRMDGADKGLLLLDQQPMVQGVIDRLRPQVGSLLLNANRNITMWESFGCPVVADDIPGFAGPLAGVHAGLKACRTPWLMTAPCDSPFLPLDLVARLSHAALVADAELAVIRCDGQLQPVFALMKTSVLADLEIFLAGGQRKFEFWQLGLKHVIVDFDDEAAFANINTPGQLAAVQQAPAADQ